MPENGELMMPREVAKLFGVDPITVSRWAQKAERAGRENPDQPPPFLAAILKLPGKPGHRHRRYRRSVIEKLMEEGDFWTT